MARATARMGRFLRRLTRGMAAETLAGQPDQALVQRLIAGPDEAAFAALVRRHGPARELALSGCKEPPASQFAQRGEVICLPGSPRRALSAATAADLSDGLFSLALACCSPLPSGPLALMPFVLL